MSTTETDSRKRSHDQSEESDYKAAIARAQQLAAEFSDPTKNRAAREEEEIPTVDEGNWTRLDQVSYQQHPQASSKRSRLADQWEEQPEREDYRYRDYDRRDYDHRRDREPRPRSFEQEQPRRDYGRHEGGRRGEDSEKMYIPNSHVGLIIGKGGEKIKELQQISGAQIKMMRDTEIPPGSMEREVTLIGSDSQRLRARDLIEDLCSKGGRVQELKRELEVPSDKVGLIIGKGGATINELKARSGAHIQVQKDNTGLPTTIVTIVAKSQESLEAACAMIEERTYDHFEGRSRYGDQDYRGGSRGRRNDDYEGYDSYGRYPDEYQGQQGYYQKQQPEPHSDDQWLTAVDPNTGHPYYYHAQTGETSWTKPV